MSKYQTVTDNLKIKYIESVEKYKNYKDSSTTKSNTAR